MKTISVIARKGGSGKTTVALHLAIAAHRARLKTLLVDADSQGSATEVLKVRGQDGPRTLQCPGDQLFEAGSRTFERGEPDEARSAARLTLEILARSLSTANDG